VITDITEKVTPIAAGLIKQFDLYFDDVDISLVKFVENDYGKVTKFLAKCHAVGSLYEYFTGCCYIIEFACPIFNTLTDKQKEIVLLHELFHIPPGGTDPDNNMYMKLRQHTIQDFTPITERYGVNWQWKDFEAEMLGDK